MTDADTLKTNRQDLTSQSTEVLAATVVCHPELQRVGERALLGKLSDATARISRSEPTFLPPGSLAGQTLDDRYISRNAVIVRATGGELMVDASETSTTVRVDAETVTGVKRVPADQLQSGVVLRLGRVVVVLHVVRGLSPHIAETHGLIGGSEALRRVREHIGRIAGEPLPVLIRGESGVGKELVARAIHAAGARGDGPFVALNMAAVPGGTAAAELFGHTRGAFTGAVGEHPGAFGQADGGTLFLDEIGEAGTDIQAMLLRALETGEVQRVGGRSATRVDVRVIAATDAALESAIERGTFRLPLLHRLAGYEIRIPPLRERRDDIGVMIARFIHEEGDVSPGWLTAEAAERLVLHPWPGNVRQLRNVIRQAMVTSAEQSSIELPELASTLPTADVTRSGREVTAADVIAALREHRWEPTAAARALGMSRAAIYDRMERIPGIRSATDSTAAEIEAALQAHDRDADRAAAALEVSRRGLRRQMTKLGVR